MLDIQAPSGLVVATQEVKAADDYSMLRELGHALLIRSVMQIQEPNSTQPLTSSGTLTSIKVTTETVQHVTCNLSYVICPVSCARNSMKGLFIRLWLPK